MSDNAPKSAVQHVRDFQDNLQNAMAWFKQNQREQPTTWWLPAHDESGYEIETGFFRTQYLIEQWKEWQFRKAVLYQRAVDTVPGVVGEVDAMVEEFQALAGKRPVGASNG